MTCFRVAHVKCRSVSSNIQQTCSLSSAHLWRPSMLSTSILRPSIFFWALPSFLSFCGLAPVRQGDCKMAPPLFSPPVFKHGTRSSSCNQAEAQHSAGLLRCANREEGCEQTSFPAAGLSCPAVELWLCGRVLYLEICALVQSI